MKNMRQNKTYEFPHVISVCFGALTWLFLKNPNTYQIKFTSGMSTITRIRNLEMPEILTNKDLVRMPYI